MSRYFFHHYDGSICVDDEGTELASLDAARAFALRAIRDTAGHQLFDGTLHLTQRIEIAERSGEVVGIVRFSDAVTIVG
jgi:hypothetical protein